MNDLIVFFLSIKSRIFFLLFFSEDLNKNVILYLKKKHLSNYVHVYMYYLNIMRSQYFVYVILLYIYVSESIIVYMYKTLQYNTYVEYIRIC